MTYIVAFMVWPTVSVIYSTARSIRSNRTITQQLQIFSQTLAK
jgi:hypothetical protein